MEWNSGSIHACQIWRADQYMLIICFVLNHLCIFLYVNNTNGARIFGFTVISFSFTSYNQSFCVCTSVCCAKKLVTLTLNSWFSSPRHRVRSASSSTVLIPSTCRLTLGDRASPVAAAKAWNSLPHHVRDATSLLAFRRQLKTVLFRQSYSD